MGSAIKKVWKRVLLGLGAVFILVGIPILINECYKAGDGYITMWDASDVLSYYGTVVGAVIAVATIAITISFNRKQIQRENYLKTETDRWAKIEEEIAKALDKINPQRLLMVNAKSLKYGATERHNYAISEIQQYQMDCRVALDQVIFYLTPTDHTKLKPLLNAISSASEEFFEIAMQEYMLYTQISKISGRGFAAELVKVEKIEQQNVKLAELYSTTYRNISPLKCKIFNEIYAEIQENADQILRLGGKR